ncbi:alpha/beta hydrolase family protein [Paenibacillus swuensis]|uniref:hypothetical protein n=1 Tax=Paenibacillus swuensis TaxID=1178515 RepID=UPI0008381237|nr:hypothetical protein [Paenibacillus swuensis]
MKQGTVKGMSTEGATGLAKGTAMPEKVEVHLFIMAGLATSPDFFDGFQGELSTRFRSKGVSARIDIVYPYGNWSRRLIPQLREIRRDVFPWRNRTSRYEDRLGGLNAAEAVKASYAGGALYLVGHSAGGTAAVHAGLRLLHEGFPLGRLVQIGSPKSPLPDQLRAISAYFYATNATGRPTDRVTRLGSWGGLDRSRSRLGKIRNEAQGMLPRWNSMLYAPERVTGICLRGGHADYFRTSQAYRNAEGVANLTLTTDAVWSWLDRDR